MTPFLKKLLPLIILIAAVSAPNAVFAVNILPACIANGDCGINDIVQTFVNVARLIMGFVGSIVLVYFVYGGFVWLTAGGSPDKIKKGWGIIRNTVIGLAIVFGAFTIVQFIYSAFDVQRLRFGQACPNNQPGIWVPEVSRGGTVGGRCVNSCTQLNPSGTTAGTGYSCISADSGTNCIYGLDCTSPGQACCQPRAP